MQANTIKIKIPHVLLYDIAAASVSWDVTQVVYHEKEHVLSTHKVLQYRLENERWQSWYNTKRYTFS